MGHQFKATKIKPAVVLLTILALGICWAAPPARAEAPTPPPFGVPNQSPLALALLPFSPAPAWVDQPGSQSFRLTTAYSSVFTRQNTSRASLNLDMEVYYLALRYDYVLKKGLQLGVELPLAGYWGGFLDSFVEDFHRAFGLPNAGREKVPQNLVRYSASHRGQSLINQQSDQMGLGDLRLYGQWVLIEDRRAKRGLSLLAQATLPSGEVAKGLGAGGAGFGLGLAFDQGWGAFSFNANAMGLYLQNAELLAPLEVQNTLAASASLGWACTENLVLMGQLNGATPLYKDSGLAGLDNGLLQLLLGLQYLTGPKSRLMMSFAEDLIASSSPDFTLSLEWRITF